MTFCLAIIKPDYKFPVKASIPDVINAYPLERTKEWKKGFGTAFDIRQEHWF